MSKCNLIHKSRQELLDEFGNDKGSAPPLDQAIASGPNDVVSGGHALAASGRAHDFAPPIGSSAGGLPPLSPFTAAQPPPNQAAPSAHSGGGSSGSGGSHRPSSNEAMLARPPTSGTGPPIGTCLSFWKRATCNYGQGCAYMHNLPPQDGKPPLGVCEKFWQGKTCLITVGPCFSPLPVPVDKCFHAMHFLTTIYHSTILST